MTNLKTEPDYCEFIIGSAAPGGYVWVFPKGDDTANVGIGVLLSKLKKPGEVKTYLDKFIKKDPRLSCGQPLEAIAGAVSVSPPLDKTVMDGLMLVGDAARVIDPITGGGIANGLHDRLRRRQGAGRSASRPTTSARRCCMEYDDGVARRDGERLYRNWMAKEKFLTLSDKTLDSVIDTLSTAGVDKMSVLQHPQGHQGEAPRAGQGIRGPHLKPFSLNLLFDFHSGNAGLDGERLAALVPDYLHDLCRLVGQGHHAASAAGPGELGPVGVRERG